jgi:hypothetical protein
MLLLRPCDAASLRDDAAFEAIFESQRRAWRGSVEGVLVDARIYAEPWGFAIEDVRVPVRLWHGIKIALSPFGWRKKSRTVSRIAKRDSFKTKDIIRCRSAICARFLRI